MRNTMQWIVDHSTTLAEMARTGEIAVVGAMYDVSTGRVEFLDGAGDAHPSATKLTPVTR